MTAIEPWDTENVPIRPPAIEIEATEVTVKPTASASQASRRRHLDSQTGAYFVRSFLSIPQAVARGFKIALLAYLQFLVRSVPDPNNRRLIAGTTIMLAVLLVAAYVALGTPQMIAALVMIMFVPLGIVGVVQQ